MRSFWIELEPQQIQQCRMDFQMHKTLVDLMEHLGVQFGDSLSQILIQKV